MQGNGETNGSEYMNKFIQKLYSYKVAQHPELDSVTNDNLEAISTGLTADDTPKNVEDNIVRSFVEYFTNAASKLAPKNGSGVTTEEQGLRMALTSFGSLDPVLIKAVELAQRGRYDSAINTLDTAIAQLNANQYHRKGDFAMQRVNPRH
ncbi:hypothetical protein HQ529_01765 [Candidatus Woesearchaeota archaeon]|nr:hypothetical protein [Candidatus Woesearchaeota archaeon]